MSNPYFVSYSRADGKDQAFKLAEELTAGEPSIPVWIDKHELQAGIDWDEQIVDALRKCEGLLFVMTEDSVDSRSVCKNEWTRALKYKKPIIPLLFHADAEMPFRLEPRQYIGFTGNYDTSLAQLRKHLRWRSSAEGGLQTLKERMADANRDLQRADADQKARIEDEIAQVEEQIADQQALIANPQAVEKKARDSIERGLERERQPTEPVAGKHATKFINPPPGTAPSWFQDRHVETELVGDFLKDPGLRMMTVVGRGGIGKTVMVCRLLKALEAGHLPDDLGPLSVDGIVYLSPKGLRQVTLPHLYADLCRLLTPETAEFLDTVYRNPQAPARAKMQALLESFPGGRTVVLLDNFEEVVDSETGTLHDQEFEQALRALLELPAHAVKVIITTRVAPRALLLTQPGRQTHLALDEGLPSPFAENILRAQDADGKLGLRDAPDALLATARERTRGYPRALEALAAILAVDRSTTLEEVLADAERLLPEQVVEELVGEAFSRLDLPGPASDAGARRPGRPGAGGGGGLCAAAPCAGHRQRTGAAPAGQHAVRPARGRALPPAPGRPQLRHGTDPRGHPADREASPPPFTRFALLHRAGEYYQSIRTPRASWKTIEDLAPQLAEFEVRIAGEEYDAAASVLLEIDFDYLMLWGHSRLAAELHERLKGRLTDRELIRASCINLGICYYSLGDYRRAIDHHEQSLAIAREIGDRQGEGVALGNLGICYYSLGDYPRAIDHHEQALAIAREIGDRQGEGSPSATWASATTAWDYRAPSIITSSSWPSPARSATPKEKAVPRQPRRLLRQPGGLSPRHRPSRAGLGHRP